MKDQFIKAILNDPENDLPRLLFADWLEDHPEKCNLCPTLLPKKTRSGFVAAEKVANFSCPLCNGNGSWRSGEFDYEKRCSYCEISWTPERKDLFVGRCPNRCKNGYLGERSEFIRRQCIDNSSEEFYTSNFIANRFWKNWVISNAEDFSKFDCNFEMKVIFRRGFIEEVTIPDRAWAILGSEIVKEHPIKRVNISNRLIFNDLLPPELRNKNFLLKEELEYVSQHLITLAKNKSRNK